MADEADQIDEGMTKPVLKVAEPEVNVVSPWADDELDRQKIAERLTRIVEDQEAPFVISLDGPWGTGKTFLLKRWQQDLANNRFQAIYFNAWKDDFCDDPLLAIIGQLTEHFQEGKLRAMAAIIGDIALPILTGRLTGVALTRKDLKRDNLLNDYRTQLRTKREIRKHLARLAAVVKEQSGKPLVFIIDELDRCRPTFAIELLERVKHIFDSPNVVFVFGINRSELVKSLESVYGEIDAGVYLRRFFDMEFILPDADPETFCQYLVQRYGLDSFFSDLSKRTGHNFHAKEFGQVTQRLPMILGHMGLSLRDMDYCIRLMALAGRELHGSYSIHPEVFAFLIAVKITDPELYRRFVQGDARGAELVNHLNRRRVSGSVKRPGSKDRARRYLDLLEGAVYSIDDSDIVIGQLELLRHGLELTQSEYLADETAKLNGERDKDRLDAIVGAIRPYSEWDDTYPPNARSLAELIDLYGGTLSR